MSWPSMPRALGPIPAPNKQGIVGACLRLSPENAEVGRPQLKSFSAVKRVSGWPWLQETLTQKQKTGLGVVLHTFNPNSREGAICILEQPGLRSEF